MEFAQMNMNKLACKQQMYSVNTVLDWHPQFETEYVLFCIILALYGIFPKLIHFDQMIWPMLSDTYGTSYFELLTLEYILLSSKAQWMNWFGWLLPYAAFVAPGNRSTTFMEVLALLICIHNMS